MRVITAETMGMCFGVRDALAALDRLPDPETVTIHGELVHNETVLADLRSRGFRMAAEGDRGGLPATARILITAHGVSDRERRRMRAAGKTVIDTTCPLVRRAHRAARRLAAEGRHVLVIGRRGHVEVRGLTGDIESFDVVEGPEEARELSHRRLGVVCQTTTPERLARETLEAIRDWNPTADIRFVDTVCRPTKDRQSALDRLLSRVDALVVVGGGNSNNTRMLVERARARGLPAFHVQSALDLDTDWFAGTRTVGLTAGTSTPEDTIREVYVALDHWRVTTREVRLDAVDSLRPSGATRCLS